VAFVRHGPRRTNVHENESEHGILQLHRESFDFYIHSDFLLRIGTYSALRIASGFLHRFLLKSAVKPFIAVVVE